MFEVSDGNATEEIRRFFQPVDKPSFAVDFVTLAEHLREMGRADPTTLDHWLERAVRAATLDAVFADS